jgi:hypothetical protein
VAQLAVATTPTAVANNAQSTTTDPCHTTLYSDSFRSGGCSPDTHLTALDESIGRVSDVLRLSQPKMISLSGRSG